MVQPHFPLLANATLAAINTVGAWLAQDDLSVARQAPEIDAVILAGNAVLPTIDAACRIASQIDVPLLISGGIGHSTPFLYEAIRNHPRYHTLPVAGRAEANILADVARAFWQIPEARLWVEDRSTNCGENARFSWNMLKERQRTSGRVLVAQDPTMQRRTMATFARVCRDEPASPQWISHPGFTPTLQNGTEGVEFSGVNAGLWPVDRYLSLVLGELPRLYDDVNGYGPAGRDFIAHVAFPEAVTAAWEQLQQDPVLKGARKIM
ncbi:YdcF family protein [Enterobacter bugandensis]|uniref:YdcF family protein n=1 Tax=Enterobacter bugandensis TaxID=881260 RepID=UPI0021D18A88|nr:YdcF family protein [Enterobacter bugandensis]MCU6158943.1 YdcF family protein [Enterobacter bugandensis]